MQTNLSFLEIPFSSLSKRDTIYISAKMTGLEDLGAANLNSAEAKLREAGFVNIINPYHGVDQDSSPTWSDCLKVCIKDILNRNTKACVLITKNDVLSSKGVVLELVLFLALGIPIFNEYGDNISPVVMSKISEGHLHSKWCQMIESNLQGKW